MNKVQRLERLLGKTVWLQTAGCSTQGRLQAIDGEEVHIKPGNAAYTDLYVYVDEIEQIMVLDE